MASTMPDFVHGLNPQKSGRLWVSITEVCGEWHVLVEESGNQSAHAFEIEQFAVVYAESQKVRLGLNMVKRA